MPEWFYSRPVAGHEVHEEIRILSALQIVSKSRDRKRPAWLVILSIDSAHAPRNALLVGRLRDGWECGLLLSWVSPYPGLLTTGKGCYPACPGEAGPWGAAAAPWELSRDAAVVCGPPLLPGNPVWPQGAEVCGIWSDLFVYPDLIGMDPGHLVYASCSLSICPLYEFHRQKWLHYKGFLSS